MFTGKYEKRKIVRAKSVREFDKLVQQNLSNGWVRVGEEKVDHRAYTSEYTQVMEFAGKQNEGA